MKPNIYVSSVQTPKIKTPGYKLGLENLEINLEYINYAETVWEVKLLHYIPKILIHLTKFGYKAQKYKDYSHCIAILGEKQIPNKSSSSHKNIRSSCPVKIQIIDDQIPLGIYSMKFEASYIDGYAMQSFEFSQKIIIKRTKK